MMIRSGTGSDCNNEDTTLNRIEEKALGYNENTFICLEAKDKTVEIERLRNNDNHGNNERTSSNENDNETSNNNYNNSNNDNNRLYSKKRQRGNDLSNEECNKQVWDASSTTALTASARNGECDTKQMAGVKNVGNIPKHFKESTTSCNENAQQHSLSKGTMSGSVDIGSLPESSQQPQKSPPPGWNVIHQYPTAYQFTSTNHVPYNRIPQSYSSSYYFPYPSVATGPLPPGPFPVQPIYNPFESHSLNVPPAQDTTYALNSSQENSSTRSKQSKDLTIYSSVSSEKKSNEPDDSPRQLTGVQANSNIKPENSGDRHEQCYGTAPYPQSYLYPNQPPFFGIPQHGMMFHLSHPLPPIGHPGMFMNNQASYHQHRQFLGPVQPYSGPAVYNYTESPPETESHPQPSNRRGIQLALACDIEQLSDYQVMVRQQLEIFEANVEDVDSNTQGRKKSVVIGQVGLRCKHCASIPLRSRGRGAVYYPAKLNGVYQAAQNMAGSHLCEACTYIPSEIREEIRNLRNRRDNASGGKQYWADGCRALGIYETDDGLKLRNN